MSRLSIRQRRNRYVASSLEVECVCELLERLVRPADERQSASELEPRQEISWIEVETFSKLGYGFIVPARIDEQCSNTGIDYRGERIKGLCSSHLRECLLRSSKHYERPHAEKSR